MRFKTIILLLTLVATIGRGADQQDEIDKRIKSAKKLAKDGDDKTALLVLEQLNAKYVNYAPAYYEKAKLLEKQNNVPEAVKAYEYCLRMLLGQRDSAKNRNAADKCRKAIYRLDKSRRIVLEHAKELEREALKFKDKDDYSYKRLTELVEYMRGEWDRSKEQEKIEEYKKQIAARYVEFNEAVIKGDLKKASEYIDPVILKFAGMKELMPHLKLMHNATKALKLQDNDVRIKEVELSGDLKFARVIGQYRVVRKWQDQDPVCWIIYDDKWYVGDEKKLKEFDKKDE